MFLSLATHNLNPSSVISVVDVRAVVTATLCRAIMYELEIPTNVEIEFLDKVIVTQDLIRTAQLCYNNINDFKIMVFMGNRGRDEVINSIYHELTHLIRIINHTFKLDPTLEEHENLIEMKANYPPIGWICGVLILDSTGELESISDYGKNQQDIRNGELVREGDSGARVGL